MMQPKATVALFAKPPVPGATKSRLAKAIGDKHAADLALAMLKDLWAQLQYLDNVHLQLWHPPGASAGLFPQHLDLEAATLREQKEGDLGERMLAVVRENADADRAVVIIGGDCVTVSFSDVQAAIETLQERSVVLKPADDGGYVMVGSRGCFPAMFQDVAWGTDSVFQQTLKLLSQDGVQAVVLDSTFDVDTVEDLEKLRAFVTRHSRPFTRFALNQLLF